MTRRLLAALVSGLIFFGVVASTNAALVTFFGEDIAGVGGARPIADAAHASFISHLNGVNTTSFEDFKFKDKKVILNFGSAGTAEIRGEGMIVDTSIPGVVNGVNGSWATSGTKFWHAFAKSDSTDRFRVDFSKPISAFGFYGTDIGDKNRNASIILTDQNGVETEVEIGNAVRPDGSRSSGSVVYFGFYQDNPAIKYVSISFANSASDEDWFGFDDMTIGTNDQIKSSSVPEPATLLLFGLGLAGLFVMRSSREKRSVFN